MLRPALILLGCLCPRSTALPHADEDLEYFERRVRPLLVERCLECHDATAKGGLRLDGAAGWQRGGDGGAVIVPGDAEASRLILAVRYTDHELAMPPKGKLAAEEIEVLEAWVRRGAVDPRELEPAADAARVAPVDDPDLRAHWAFQPLSDPAPPAVQRASWPRRDLDRFVLARLEAAGLEPAPEADRRTLIRRVTFDLTGLPPTPEEILAFVRDERPDAWERLVDRLLDSPHYGERWGRHWLDVVRYADSNGLDENLALAHAWRYRDWVVEALNDDLAYDRFVRAQLAGDLLPEGATPQETFASWIATGMLVLGPKMLAEQDKEKLVMDVVDEQIDVVSKAFLGLTVSCARCHDHKFDPIGARDYYALAGILRSTSTLENLDHVSRWRERDLATPEELASRQAFEERLTQLEQQLAQERQVGEEQLRARWQQDLGAYLLAGQAAAEQSIAIEAEEYSRGNLNVDAALYGTPAAPIVHTNQAGLQFVEYDLTVPAGGMQRLEVRYAAEESRPMRLFVNGALVNESVLAATTGGWKAEHQRWEAVAELDLRPGRNILRLERAASVPHIDRLLLAPADSAWPSPAARAAPAGLAQADPPALTPSIVRNVALLLESSQLTHEPLLAPWHAFAQLPPERFEEQAPAVVAALREREDLSPTARGLLDGLAPISLREVAGRYAALFGALAAAPASEDEAFAAARALVDGPRSPFALSPAELEAALPPERLAALAGLRAEHAAHAATKPAPFPRALAVADAPQPVDLRVHARGSHLSLVGEPVPRGLIDVLTDALPAPEIPAAASGRLALARWLTSPEHPLTARVIVNRLWQGHFGSGIVSTPSNFGVRGAPPTHPELLDYLARVFVEQDGWSLKALHRRILCSSSYRMASTFHERAAALDPENRLLWRQRRVRLEAEAVRDAMLAVSGRLELSLGGSLLATPNAGYVTNDQSGNAAQYSQPRRSLYLPVIRNALYGMFATFDYGDPSVPSERRPQTVVASQALLLLNSPLSFECAEAFARRIAREAGDEPQARITRAFELAFGRAPSAAESARAHAFVETAAAPAEDFPSTSADRQPRSRPDTLDAESPEPAWARLCQVLLATNEFIYID